MHRESFQHKVFYNPQDLGLGVVDGLDVDDRILQTYVRFWQDGILHNHGDKCFFISHLLRRILRLHGIEAWTKQVTMNFANIEKGWISEVGYQDKTVDGQEVDTHSVVVTKNLILDWSLIKPIHWGISVRAPVAVIADLTKLNEEQTIGDFGSVVYHSRNNHPYTKNIIYDNRKDVLNATYQYFNKYRM